MKPWAVTLGAVVLLGIALLLWRAGQNQQAAVVPSTRAQTGSAAPSARIEGSQPAANVASAFEVSNPSEDASASSVGAQAESPPTEILVQGSVSDEAGALVQKFGIQWIDDAGVRRDVSGEAGSYSIPGLHPGHYLAVIWSTDLRREEHDVELEPRPESQHLDVVAHTEPRILVKVVGTDGLPLFRADGPSPPKHWLPRNSLFVRATRHPPPNKSDDLMNSGVQYSECGMFYARSLSTPEDAASEPSALGTLRLLEPPPLHISIYFGNVLVATRRIESSPHDLTFALDPIALDGMLGGVRIRLVEAEGGAPIQGATVLLDTSWSVLNQATGAEWRAEFGGQLPGAYLIQFVAHGRTPQMREIVIDSGQVLDLGDTAMRPGGMLRVRFEYPTDAHPPAHFVLVRVQPGNPLGTLTRTAGPSFGSDSEEPARVPFPGSGEFELRVTSVGGTRGGESTNLGALPTRFVLGDAPEGEIVVQLRTTTNVCLRPPRDSHGISRWLVSTADGIPCQRVRIEGRSPTRIELLPGEYTIVPIDPETKAIGKQQAFSVGREFSTVELQP